MLFQTEKRSHSSKGNLTPPENLVFAGLTSHLASKMYSTCDCVVKGETRLIRPTREISAT